MEYGDSYVTDTWDIFSQPRAFLVNNFGNRFFVSDLCFLGQDFSVKLPESHATRVISSTSQNTRDN